MDSSSSSPSSSSSSSSSSECVAYTPAKNNSGFNDVISQIDQILPGIVTKIDAELSKEAISPELVKSLTYLKAIVGDGKINKEGFLSIYETKWTQNIEIPVGFIDPDFSPLFGGGPKKAVIVQGMTYEMFFETICFFVVIIFGTGYCLYTQIPFLYDAIVNFYIFSKLYGIGYSIAGMFYLNLNEQWAVAAKIFTDAVQLLLVDFSLGKIGTGSASSFSLAFFYYVANTLFATNKNRMEFAMGEDTELFKAFKRCISEGGDTEQNGTAFKNAFDDAVNDPNNPEQSVKNAKILSKLLQTYQDSSDQVNEIGRSLLMRKITTGAIASSSSNSNSSNSNSSNSNKLPGGIGGRRSRRRMKKSKRGTKHGRRSRMRKMRTKKRRMSRRKYRR